MTLVQKNGNVERMENERIAKRVYMGECAVIHSVGRLQKSWIDTLRDGLKTEIWMSGKQGEWCMIEVNGGGF